MKISCLAIDDEPLAVKKIAGYIQKIPFLELVAECRSAFEAMEILRNHKIQLMFIDINMPDLNGMEFVKSLSDRPYVVFTTAYSEYAVEGFQVEAVDYLLKPVSFSNLLKAANKVKELVDLKANSLVGKGKTTSGHFFVKSQYKQVRIELDQIKYIESQHEYIKIHLMSGSPVLTQMSLKSVEELLPPDRFMRVHRSFIVQLGKISLIDRNRIVFDGKIYVPVSDPYKEKFQAFMNSAQDHFRFG
jgi:DNA-binding LytR/AlgR family response regulator